MRIVFALVLLIGIGLAGAAAYLAQQTFGELEADLAQARRNNMPSIELVGVAVATRELNFGSFLRPGDVKLIGWPKDNVPSGAFTDLEKIIGGEGAEPRAILIGIVKDEPILPHKVTAFGEDAGVRSRLAPGMRAFTININVSTGVSGFLQPNDRVDVYWTGDDGGRTITRLILEGVRLIAVDQVENSDISRTILARNVTVEVSPQVVAELTQAQQTGRLTLSLRGAEDDVLTGVFAVDQTDIIGNETIAVEAKPVCTLRTRKGAEVVVVEVPCPQE
ncbi:Flp pilus assembly protein CpaB [Rhodobacterales bacterium 52_120_T64]|nr:Flp pilus assembly protein CpaB [Rhodobacterales bacterium 52_120_T64]